MITPEQAQDLLRGDFGTDESTEQLGNSHADFDSFTGAYIRSTPGDIALADAAPELAEQIANMRYEYAVQVLLSDGAGGYVWHFADEDSLPFGSLKPYEVRWYTKKEAQEILDAEVDCFGPKDIRIVRRLAAEPEVAE